MRSSRSRVTTPRSRRWCAATSSWPVSPPLDALAAATALPARPGGVRPRRARAGRLHDARPLHRAGGRSGAGGVGGTAPARTHALLLGPRRDSVEPATVQDFMRFDLRWQHVAPGTQLTRRRRPAARHRAAPGLGGRGRRVGVGAVRAAGCGATTPARSIASATTVRSAGCASRRSPRDADAPAGAPSKATPISVVFRDDLSWLLEAARPVPIRPSPRWVRPPRSPRCSGREARASRSSSVRRPTGCPKTSSAPLWDGVARGLLTSDGFGAVPLRVGRSRAGGVEAARLSRLMRARARRHRPRVVGRSYPVPVVTSTRGARGGRGRDAAQPVGCRVP